MVKKTLFLLFLIILCINNSIYSSSIPNYSTFLKYKKYFKLQINKYWSNLFPKEILPAQIEQESNWNEYAERKAGKEYGFGLSQVTIVKGYFNNFLEFKKRWKKELKNWTWENRFNAKCHIKILILYDKLLYNKMKFAKINFDRLAFTLSAYNGGLGWVLKDRKLTKENGYNENRWFNNVEKFSKRNKWAFKINRKYVKNIFKKTIKYIGKF